MLLEFSCSNYKSIYEKITLSMRASNDDTRKEELISYGDKYKINRISAIYGANGSGKTTVLDAIMRAQRIIVDSMKMEVGDKIKLSPHKLAEEYTPTEFTFQFVTGGCRFAYGFSVLDGEIDEEYLYHYPNNRSTKIFSRNGLKIDPGYSIGNFSEAAMDVLKENRTFFACAANYTNNPNINKAFLFFKNELNVLKPSYGTKADLIGAIQFMTEHPKLKENYLKIVEYLGTGIKNIDATYESVEIAEDEWPDELPAIPTKGKISGICRINIEAKLSFGLFDTDLIKDESSGIKKLFAFLYPYLDTLQNGKVLICDEIETGLHESVVYEILQLFKELYSEKNAQIIFTTHDTSLLDADLFRRDQIWFTELNNLRSTELYSLAEIKNVRKKESYKKGYISGKYGAIPMMNSSLFNELLKVTKSSSEKED